MKFSLLKLKVLAGLGAGLLMLGAIPIPKVSAAGSVIGSDDEQAAESYDEPELYSLIGDDDYLLDLSDDEPVAEPTVEPAAEPDVESTAELPSLFSKNADEVQAAINVGLNINLSGFCGYTPLTGAIKDNNLESAQVLLNAGANVNVRDLHSASTALHHAVEGGKAEIVKALLNAGANPNASGFLGKTPLHLAAQKGYLVIFKLLIDHGANPFACDSDGHTPLECLDENNNLNSSIKCEVRKQLKNCMLVPMDSYKHLTDDVFSNNIDDIRRYLVLDPDGFNKNKALSEAARLGKLDIVRELIEDYHANVNNFCDIFAATPLHLAARGGHLEVVKLLLEKGANPQICDINGKLPWHLAKESGHEEVARELSSGFGDRRDFAVRVRLG